MDHRVIWSRRALNDVDEIASFIAQDSPIYSSAVVRSILNHVKTIASFPRSGRVVPEFNDDGIREVFAYSYRIIYQVSESQITIAAVIHGKRILQ
jgi:plasmid stabilization system protein ParE